MKNRYTLSETISNGISLIWTKLFYKGARLIRRPFYCRGKSHLEFGEGFTTGYHCRFDLLDTNINKSNKTLTFGLNCKIGDNVHIVAMEKVTIGDNCLMASKIFISDTNHGDYGADENAISGPEIPPDERSLSSKPVIIGNNVWIGENVCILMGTKIGNGCIIGANSTVNKNIPDNCIAVGSPAKVIKRWDNELKSWRKI